jgi:hypothetical protein
VLHASQAAASASGKYVAWRVRKAVAGGLAAAKENRRKPIESEISINIIEEENSKRKIKKNVAAGVKENQSHGATSLLMLAKKIFFEAAINEAKRKSLYVEEEEASKRTGGGGEMARKVAANIGEIKSANRQRLKA